MQESKFSTDLGLDLLMNPKRKQGNDAASISSRSSLNDDRISVRSSKAGSVKSVNIQPAVVDIGKLFGNNGDDYSETETDVSYESEISIEKPFQRPNGPPKQAPKAPLSDTSDTESQLESLGIGSVMQERRKLSDDEVLVMKKELLYQFERLEKKGLKLPKKFTLGSNLDEMKLEYDRLKRDKEVDSSIKLQRRMMMAVVSGVEWVNGKFDPLGAKLDGWSDSIYENIDDYDDIFEELHEKYKGKAKMAPEVKLIMMLGGSAFMHHMTHSMFKSQLPGLDDILKQNPELAKNLAAATSQHMAQQQQSAGSLFGSLGNMFSGLFGGGGLGGMGSGGGGAMAGGNGMGGGAQQSSFGPIPMPHSPQSQQPPQRKVQMKGPTGMDDILKELETMNNDNDRLEMMSAITESELAELADDSSSINGLLMGVTKTKQKPKKGAGKITLDI